MPTVQIPLAEFKEKFKTSWAWAFLRDNLIYNLLNKLPPGVQRSTHMDGTLKPYCQTSVIFLIHKMESLSRSVLLNISFRSKPLWEILDLPKSRSYVQRFWFHYSISLGQRWVFIKKKKKKTFQVILRCSQNWESLKWKMWKAFFHMSVCWQDLGNSSDDPWVLRKETHILLLILSCIGSWLEFRSGSHWRDSGNWSILQLDYMSSS